MEIIVNEWLLDYMRPNADEEKTKMAQFVNTVVKKCDKIVIRRPSRFTEKFYTYMKIYGYDTRFKERFSKLNKLLFHNPDKTIIVDDADLGILPIEIEGKVPPKDKYLVELAYFSKDKIIITTDNPLKEKLQDGQNIKVYLFEEFIQNYFSS